MDEYNFILVSEIYESSISVLKEINESGMTGQVDKQEVNWVTKLLKNKEYSYQELEELFQEELNKRNITFDGRCFKYYFPPFTKKVKTKNKIRATYYKFELYS
jgi:hypothetical protein